MPKSAGLPPLECCRGTSPSQAESLSAAGEAVRVGDRCDQGAGAQRADPRDLLELYAELAAAMPCLDLGFELVDESVQVLEVLGQAGD